MKRFATFLALASVLWASPALPAWELDTGRSEIAFKARFLGTTVPGTFDRFSAKVVYDEREISGSSADVTVDAASINTGIGLRDRDLRSGRYFDVKKYPTIRFRSRSVEPVSAGKLKVTGDLTLHGVTREVALDVTGPSAVEKDPSGKEHVTGTAALRIDWKDFGMGSLLIGDEFEISIRIDLVRIDDPNRETR